MSYQLRGLHGPRQSSQQIFHSIEMKKKNLETLAISQKDLWGPTENLKIMSQYFFGIHEWMNEWMKTLFMGKYLAIQLMRDTDYLHT